MSCCSCGNNCSPGCGCLYMVIPGDPSGSYSLMNVNTLGVGVADGQDGTQFNFRGVASANNSIIVTYDAGSHAIMLTLDIDEIINDLPDATTTQRGVLETATDAEAIAKVAVDKILTPSNLAALGSSTTFAGLTEYATGPETLAMASGVLAVTPLGLASLISTLGTTTTWADAAARAVLVPDFAGQVGVQLDQDILWIARGIVAGDFDRPVFGLGSNFNFSPASQTLLDLNGQDWITTNGDFHLEGCDFIFGTITPCDFDWGAVTNLLIASVQIPASSVLGTAAAGVPTSRLLNTFLSNANTTVWGLPTGTLARTILASYAGQNISNPPTEAEVQTLDDAVVALSQHVCALITDLRATLKPHAT